MAKKKAIKRQDVTRRQEAPAPEAVAPPSSAAPPPQQSFADQALHEFAKHPVLIAASVSLAITLFAIGTAIRFHDDMSMGAVREPTGMILWAGITITLFLRYRRERIHPPKSDS